jgi:hypothetical protein
MQNIDIKRLWKVAGGSQHGPIIESYYIEEPKFYDFAVALISAERNRVIRILDDLRAGPAWGDVANAIDEIRNPKQ